MVSNAKKYFNMRFSVLGNRKDILNSMTYEDRDFFIILNIKPKCEVSLYQLENTRIYLSKMQRKFS